VYCGHHDSAEFAVYCSKPQNKLFTPKLAVYGDKLQNLPLTMTNCKTLAVQGSYDSDLNKPYQI
jgi:hypothetical protein